MKKVIYILVHLQLIDILFYWCKKKTTTFYMKLLFAVYITIIYFTFSTACPFFFFSYYTIYIYNILEDIYGYIIMVIGIFLLLVDNIMMEISGIN